MSELQFIVEATLDNYANLVGQLVKEEQRPLVDARTAVERDMQRVFESACRDAGIDFTGTQAEILPRGVGELRLPTAGKANDFADALLRRAGSNDGIQAVMHAERCFRVGIDGGSVSKTGTILNTVRKLSEKAPPGGVLISEFVYAQLPDSVRRAYHGPQSVEEDEYVLKGYRRTVPNVSKAESEDDGDEGQRKRCFLIMPYIGQRSEDVLKMYIEAACDIAGLETFRADWDLSARVGGSMMSALRDDPMAIAYLGKPPWNANVMLEVGFRLAVNQPLVFLREAVEEGEEKLPFDLSDYRVIFLPNGTEQNRNPEIIRKTAQKIAEQVKAQLEEDGKIKRLWKLPHPIATARFFDNRENQYTESSREADRVFQCALKGMPVDKFVQALADLMDPHQYNAFLEEQLKLFTQVFAPDAFKILGGKEKVPIATVPIVIRRHNSDPGLINRAFLPVIERYWKMSGEVIMTVLYLDVTGVVERHATQDGELWLANLTERVRGDAV